MQRATTLAAAIRSKGETTGLRPVSRTSVGGGTAGKGGKGAATS